MTEADLLDLLRKRFTHPGNGGSGRYAFLTHVRTGAGHYQQELDAVAIALWPSEHHDCHAFEVKVSRSDWLREIRRGTGKSAQARALADTFSIVAVRGIVQRQELPTGWGLFETYGSRLAQTIASERLTPRPSLLGPPRTLPRGFVVALLRSAGAVPGMTTHQRLHALSHKEEK